MTSIFSPPRVLGHVSSHHPRNAMQPSTLLATLATLDFVTASPTPPAKPFPAADLPPAHLVPRAFLLWKPANAYSKHRAKNDFWSQLCEEALDRHRCLAGNVYQGQHDEMVALGNGEKTLRAWVNVESVPLWHGDVPRKLRVYMDGTSDDVTKQGWSERDRDLMNQVQANSRRLWEAARSGVNVNPRPDRRETADDVLRDGSSKDERRRRARAKRKHRMLVMKAKRKPKNGIFKVPYKRPVVQNWDRIE